CGTAEATPPLHADHLGEPPCMWSTPGPPFPCGALPGSLPCMWSTSGTRSMHVKHFGAPSTHVGPFRAPFPWMWGTGTPSMHVEHFSDPSVHVRHFWDPFLHVEHSRAPLPCLWGAGALPCMWSTPGAPSHACGVLLGPLPRLRGRAG